MLIPANVRKFWRNVRIAAKPKVAFKKNTQDPIERLSEVSVMLEYVGRDLATFRGVVKAGGGALQLPGLPIELADQNRQNDDW